MSVKPELVQQIQEAVENDARKDDSAFALLLEDTADAGYATATSISRKQVRHQVDVGHRDAAKEWDKAEAALSDAMRAKRQMEAEEAERDAYLRRLEQSVCSSPASPAGRDPSNMDPEERARRLEAIRAAAFLERARQMRCRASEAGKKLKDHAKRRLRIKISEILQEVKRRQSLRQSQEKVRKFREQRHRLGRGADASTGDADAFSLGIGAATDSFEDDATPRRRCLLDSLSLEELAMVRTNPRWYLEDEAFHGNTERLIDFFTPARKDRHVSIECYAQRLWSRLTAASEALQESQQTLQHSRSAGSASRFTSQGASSMLSVSDRAQDSQMLHSLSVGSLPRRDPIRADQPSPTMQKVWDTYRRKEERDAKMLEDRAQAAEERMKRNAFKVSQQLREYESSQSKYKELHKLRMSDALDRKAARDASAQERLAVMDEFKLRKMRHALDVADEQLERKRDKVSGGLEAWDKNVRRARRYQQIQERKALLQLHAKQEAYEARLAKVGDARSEKTESQAQKNDKLKARIQISLMQQLEEQRKLDCDRQAVATEQKVEAARYRRYHNATKYNFLERAFGEQVKFDHKFSYTASRKGLNESTDSI